VVRRSRFFDSDAGGGALGGQSDRGWPGEAHLLRRGRILDGATREPKSGSRAGTPGHVERAPHRRDGAPDETKRGGAGAERREGRTRRVVERRALNAGRGETRGRVAAARQRQECGAAEGFSPPLRAVTGDAGVTVVPARYRGPSATTWKGKASLPLYCQASWRQSGMLYSGITVLRLDR
jgi:hypothetical protein